MSNGDALDTTIAAVAESRFDKAGIRAVRRANDGAKRSLYPVSVNEHDYDILPREPLFTVTQRGIAPQHALVRSSGNGLGWEATREYEGHPRQAEAVRLALLKNTRVFGFALTEATLSGTEDMVSCQVQGPISLVASNLGRKIQAGDRLTLDWAPVASMYNHPAVPGQGEHKLVMQVRAYDPLVVANDVMTELALILDDPERWRRAMQQTKAADVYESLARTWFAADQTELVAGLRELIAADVIQFTPAFEASVPASAYIERATLAAGRATRADRLNYAHAGLAVVGEWLGLTHNNVYPNPAGRGAWKVLARNLAGAMAYDGTNPSYEFGHSPASAAPNGLPANRSRYERSNELRQGDPYGDLATLQINAPRARLTAIAEYIDLSTKNVFGTATSAPGGETGVFNAFVSTSKK